jgi:hypothetical protein
MLSGLILEASLRGRAETFLLSSSLAVAALDHKITKTGRVREGA